MATIEVAMHVPLHFAKISFRVALTMLTGQPHVKSYNAGALPQEQIVDHCSLWENFPRKPGKWGGFFFITGNGSQYPRWSIYLFPEIGGGGGGE